MTDKNTETDKKNNDKLVLDVNKALEKVDNNIVEICFGCVLQIYNLLRVSYPKKDAVLVAMYAVSGVVPIIHKYVKIKEDEDYHLIKIYSDLIVFQFYCYLFNKKPNLKLQ